MSASLAQGSPEELQAMQKNGWIRSVVLLPVITDGPYTEEKEFVSPTNGKFFIQFCEPSKFSVHLYRS